MLRVKKVLPYLITAAISLLLGFFTAKSGVLEFDPKVTADVLIDAFVALVLATFVAYIINRQSEDSRHERDLLITRAEEAKTTIKDLAALVDTGKYDYGHAATRCAVARKAIYTLNEWLVRLDHGAANTTGAKIEDDLRVLKDQLTTKVAVQNQVTLDSQSKAEIEKQVALILENYFQMILEINSGKLPT